MLDILWTDPLMPTVGAMEVDGEVKECMLKDIRMIGAVSINGIMGNKGHLPWKCKSDMQFFKSSTMGHRVVMGKETCLSFKRPLAGRENIVVTRDTSFKRDGFRVVHDVQTIIDEATFTDVTWIIGGPKLYRLFIDHIVEIRLSIINQVVSGDAVFPSHLLNGFNVSRTKDRDGCTVHTLHKGSSSYEFR